MILVRGWVPIVCVGVLFGLLACVDEDMVDGMFTPPEWKKIQGYSPVPMPPPASPTNRFADDEQAAAFGQRMWFEKRYSGAITVVGPGAAGEMGETGKYSCASCHDAKHWFIDTRTEPNILSIGERVVGKGLAWDIVTAWLDEVADMDARHARRREKIEL